jgi:hypothetical protein
MHALPPRVPCLVSISLVFFPHPKPLAARFYTLFVGSFGPLVVVTVTFMPFGVFSISQLSISHTVVSSGREASEKKRAETRRGQGQCWGEAGDGARELLPLKLKKSQKVTLCLSSASW